MWDLVHKTIILSQKVRTVILSSIIQKSGVTATQLTIASFIAGITAVFFFDTIWFIMFGILHLLFDACDGIAARTEGTTERGKYMDWLSDQTAALFLMVTITQLMPTQLIVDENSSDVRENAVIPLFIYRYLPTGHIHRFHHHALRIHNGLPPYFFQSENKCKIVCCVMKNRCNKK